jgi:monoterpene epsilon-lactone hydrolase
MKNQTARMVMATLTIVVMGILIAAAPWAQGQSTNDLSQAPLTPQVKVDDDGTVHWGPRTIPFAPLASTEAKQAYIWLVRFALDGQPTDAKEFGPWFANHVPALFAREKSIALKLYPVTEQDQKIGGVDTTVYTPKTIAAKNRNKVIFEYEVDSTAIAIASLAQTKVIAVHYGRNPAVEAHREIVAVYKEMLKTYEPKNIGMFGTSGGCALLHTTMLWLPELKLPFPGAVGLLTCTGRADPGDTQVTQNGLDPILSAFLFPTRPQGRPVDISKPRVPGEPPRTPLDGEIPRGYPPSYLLAGTRDMCLSETVLLHRKLRNAGVDADLNVFEGMWHGFYDDTDVPESKEALTDLARFLNARLGK